MLNCIVDTINTLLTPEEIFLVSSLLTKILWKGLRWVKYLHKDACINRLVLLDLDILDGIQIIKVCFAWTKCGPM